MNKKVLIGFGVLGALAVAGAAGYGGWYAWDTGLIPGNKRAPTAEAMLPAVKKSAEFRSRMYRQGVCLGPEAGRLHPDLQGRPGIANRNLPGQHAVSFLLEGPLHTQDARERMLQQYGFLAKQGFYNEADANLDTDAGPRPAKEFRLTWKGFAALAQDYQPCFALGRREFTRIEKIERVPAETLGMELWDVSYHSEAGAVPDWAKGADAKALFPRYVDATAPKVEKVRLMRGKEGWLTEQEMQMQLQISQLRAAGQDPNVLAVQMAQALKAQAPGEAPDAATVKKLFYDYLASEQWQTRSQAVCVPLQLQRGGDERGTMQYDRTSFSATWYDAPSPPRQDYQRQQMLTQLHIFSALEAAGLATLEKSGAGTVNNQPVPAGVRFSVKPEAIEALGLATGGCMAIGRFGKIELVGHSDSGAGGVRLAARGELMLVQPWAQSLARWLPALKAVIEEGVPFTGQLSFSPSYDRSTGAPTEPAWRVSGLNPSYPQIQFSQVPAALQAYLPQTTQASLKLVKAPPVLPGLPGISQPAPQIQVVPAPQVQIAPAPAPRAVPQAVPATPVVPAPAPKPRSEAPYPAGSAEVHVVSVYQGQLPGGAQRGFRQHPEGWIDVTVKRMASPALLFLSAYEPVEWRVKVEGGSVKRIIAIGYHEQRVTVTGQRGVEITTDRAPQFFANARLDLRGTFPYEGRGNKGLQAAEIVNALFGKPPASFQGEYEGRKTFTVDEASPKLVLPRPQSVATTGAGSVTLKGPRYASSIGPLTVQYGGAGAYTEAWASRAYTAGKVYFEATLHVEGGGLAQPHANVGVAELDSKGAMENDSVDAQTPAIPHGEQKVYKSGDVFGVAVDYDAGVMYVRVNGHWLTGEPGSGRGKRFRVGRERAAYLFATGGGHGERRGAVSWTANFGANHFAQPLPKGYASYDGAQR